VPREIVKYTSYRKRVLISFFGMKKRDNLSKQVVEAILQNCFHLALALAVMTKRNFIRVVSFYTSKLLFYD